MPQYLNLNVNGDWIRGRPGYEDLFYWSLSLLQMARSGNVSTGGAGSLTFSPSEITLTQEGDYFTGSVTLTNGINGTYDLMDDMPEGKQILGHNGADQETLTIKIPVAYAELLDEMRHYNMRLYTYKQRDLNCKSAYELSEFTLTDYGLPDEKFGVISIPKLDLEMPLFLGASEANMAAGAAVLSQTSIPIGGEYSNSVIAGHRGWNGYPYFLDIEKLEEGDEVTITNIWGTLRYQVTETQIIAPNDVNAILIRPNKDLITLLTCHPPNTGGRFRYLVFCERMEDAK